MFDKLEILNKSRYTLCSKRATKHGFNQHVISVSAYSSDKDNINLKNNIWIYIIEFLNEAKYFYPNWRVRIYYHNINKTINELIKIENIYKNVDFCDVYNIPLLGNIHSFMSGRIHRFIPIADRFVDILMSRDIDSPILKREVISVNQWLLSNKLYHIMRDHQFHSDVILAGLWAFKIYFNKTITNQLIKPLLTKSIINCYQSNNSDQIFLFNFIWPIVKEQSLQHDSFHCQKYHLTKPFTLPKLSRTLFVGCRRPCLNHQHLPLPCPIKCLPVNYTNQYLC